MTYYPLYNIKKPKNPAFTKIITRAGIFTGLSFNFTKEKDINKTTVLSSVPNISFSFDYASAIFDYGQSKNNNDLELINGLFTNMAEGTTFSMTQGNFLIDGEETKADLSGIYSFTKIINNTIITKPISINSINSKITIYENKFFLSIPQLQTTNPALDNAINYTITNSLLSDKLNSFTSFGIYSNDYIQIKGSVNNNLLFKVISVIKNNDGSETLIVENQIIQETCFGIPIIIELIQTGPYTLNYPEKAQDTVVGSCVLNIPDNTVICYDNQTENQCAIRSAEKSAISFTWNKGAECSISEAPTIGKRKPIPTTRKTTLNEKLSKNIITTQPKRSQTKTISESLTTAENIQNSASNISVDNI